MNANVPAPIPTACEVVRYDAGGQPPVLVPAHHYWKPVCCTSCAMTKTSCARGEAARCPDCTHGRWTCMHCGATT